jgi:hypothetical protein
VRNVQANRSNFKSVVLTRMVGDTAKAKAAYKEFLTLRKDDDPDIPVLRKPTRSMRSCNSSSRQAVEMSRESCAMGQTPRSDARPPD